MAITFVAASTQYFNTGSAILTGVPITMGCWFNSTSVTTNQTLMCLGDTGGDEDYFQLWILGAVAGDYVRATTRSAAGVVQAISTAGYSGNTWHHACAVYADTDDRTVYLDGGNSHNETTARTPAGIDAVGIGRLERATPGAYMDGMIAEAAIWNVALSLTEVESLAAGFSPAFVRREGLVGYWPMRSLESNDKIFDEAAGYSMPSTNSPTESTDHPRIFYPGGPTYRQVAYEAAGIGGYSGRGIGRGICRGVMR